MENKEELTLSENTGRIIPAKYSSLHSLRADCDNCFGFCCVALHFSASEGFPIDKDAGQACLNLQTDFRCAVHESLRERGLKGCTAYECLGAGQKIAQVTFGGRDWRQAPESAPQMFEVFLIMRQLHELIWYLTEALSLQPASSIHSELSAMQAETGRLTNLDAEALIKLDVAAHRAVVNVLLRQVSELVRAEVGHGKNSYPGRKKTLGRRADLIGADLIETNLRGADLRGAYLIAADLSGADLTGSDLIGADMRDTNVRGTDLSGSIFLTQAQINVAKGDAKTKLPPSLTRPAPWSTGTAD